MTTPPLFTGKQDQDPRSGATVIDPRDGLPGCIHDHETASGKRYRHSHVDFHLPHTHPRNKESTS